MLQCGRTGEARSSVKDSRAAQGILTSEGSVPAGPYCFLFLPSSARAFHSLHISRTNPATVAKAAAMKRSFSTMATLSFRQAPPASDPAGTFANCSTQRKAKPGRGNAPIRLQSRFRQPASSPGDDIKGTFAEEAAYVVFSMRAVCQVSPDCCVLRLPS